MKDKVEFGNHIAHFEKGPAHNLVVCVTDVGGERKSVDIILPVRFQFVGFKETEMNGANIWEWKPLSQLFEDWKKRFAEVVEDTWTPTFQLINKETIAYLNFTVLDVKNIPMAYDFVQDKTGALRSKVKVLRVKVFPGSGDGAHSTQWASEISLLAGDVLEEAKGTTSTGKKIMQIDAAHEVGHALGFDHPFGTHGAKSYGDPDDPESHDIMGLGMVAWRKQDRLFKGILRDILSGDWRIYRPERDQHSSQRIRFQRFQPQTRDGIGAGNFVKPGPLGSAPSDYA